MICNQKYRMSKRSDDRTKVKRVRVTEGKRRTCQEGGSEGESSRKKTLKVLKMCVFDKMRKGAKRIK